MDIRISLVSNKYILMSSVILISNGICVKTFVKQQMYSYNERCSFLKCSYIQIWLYCRNQNQGYTQIQLDRRTTLDMWMHLLHADQEYSYIQLWLNWQWLTMNRYNNKRQFWLKHTAIQRIWNEVERMEIKKSERERVPFRSPKHLIDSASCL